jgi:hypothetical protein
MVALGLVTRTRFKEMPPRVELELTVAGYELLPVAGALAQWGARHLWSAPREHEQVDLSGLLHLLPLLLGGATRLPAGWVEAIVEDTDPPLHRRYRVEKGRLRADDSIEQIVVGHTERQAGSARGAKRTIARQATSVQGTSDAWIAAIGPAGDCTQLHIDGDRRLAQAIMDALGR